MATLRPYACVAFSLETPREKADSHFLNACALCRRPLAHYRDIFMYRGDTPFCSEECRQEQIDVDEYRDMEAIQHSLRRRHRHHRIPPHEEQPPASHTQPVIKAAVAAS